MDRVIGQTFKIGSVLTDVTTAKLSDPTGTYGVKRNDTGAMVVAAGTAMTRTTTGTYQYTLAATATIAYTAYMQFVYDGDTFYVELDLPAASADDGMVVSYTSLMERVEHQLFGTRGALTADGTTDCEDCIRDGLNRVYAAHNWSFFRPVKTITTVNGTSTYSLPIGYEGIETEMHYAPGLSDYYPPVRQRHDSEIRSLQQDNTDTDRPRYFSIRSVEFDPTVGSLRQLVLYPTPDAAYVLYARMRLRQVMIDATNQYPIGGEMLGQVILEACLAAAEHAYDEQPGVHEKLFLEMLPAAIAADLERSSPTTLGPDAPSDEIEYCVSRAMLCGNLTFNGDLL